ncbi:MAG: lipase family protein [Acidimicrobiales bacterium]
MARIATGTTAGRPGRRRRLDTGVLVAVLLAALTVLAAACSADEPAREPAPATPSTGPAGAPQDSAGSPLSPTGPLPAAPDGDAFYVPPDPLPAGSPGEVIWARPLPNPIGGGTAWQVLYRSSAENGDPVAVSGLVVVPPGPPPAGGRRLVALAHSTTGLADACAPSRAVAAPGSTGGQEVAAVASGAMAQGWVLAATDYRGLGTPGTHPYLVGQLAGRDVLDLARAASELPDSAVDDSSPVAVLGHSQGGGASIFAAELAPTYAPELRLVGAVAGAPVTELGRRVTRWPPAPGQDTGFALMTVAGFHAAYPELDLGSVLSEEGRAALPTVEDGCVGEVLTAFGDDDPTQLFTPDGPDRNWQAALEANVAGRQPTGVPVYVFHGDADAVVPAAWSADYQARACAAGVDVTRVLYPGLDHGSVLLSALPPAFGWLSARLDGRPTPPGCPGG